MVQSSNKQPEVLLSLPKVYIKQIQICVEVGYFKSKKRPPRPWTQTQCMERSMTFDGNTKNT